jgi:mannosylfructose-phosphate synthase
MHLPPNLITLWLRGDVTAPAPADAADAARVLEQAESLARAGHRIEVWTRRCDDHPETDVLPSGVQLRRFPVGDCGCVRTQTPGEYTAEFLARATDHLAHMNGHTPMLVTHHWDAGLAGRMLAARFGLNHVHVPHALATEESPRPAAARLSSPKSDAQACRDLARRTREEREACRAATSVIAANPAQREALLAPPYNVPAKKSFIAPPDAAADATTDDNARAPLVTQTASAAAAAFDVDWSQFLRPTTLGVATVRDHRPLGVESRLLKLAACDDVYL